MNCPDYKNCGNMFLFRLSCILGGIIFGMNIAFFNNFGSVLMTHVFEMKLPEDIEEVNHAVNLLNLCFGFGGLLSCLVGGFMMKLMSRRISTLVLMLAHVALTFIQVTFGYLFVGDANHQESYVNPGYLSIFYFLRFGIGFITTYYTFLIPVICKEYLRNKCRGPMISWFYVGIAFGTFLPNLVCVVFKDFLAKETQLLGEADDTFVTYFVRFVLIIPALIDLLRFVILCKCFNCESPYWELLRLIQTQPVRYSNISKKLRRKNNHEPPREEDLDRVPINYDQKIPSFAVGMEEEDAFVNEDSQGSEDSSETLSSESSDQLNHLNVRQFVEGLGDKDGENKGMKLQPIYEPLNPNGQVQYEGELDMLRLRPTQLSKYIEESMQPGSDLQSKLLRDLKQSLQYQKYHSCFFPKETFHSVAKFMTSEFTKTFDQILIARSYKFYKILGHSKYRLQVFVIILLNFLNQMTGINCLIFYSTNIFKKMFDDMGMYHSELPGFLSLMVSVANIVGALFVPFLINRVGRRGLLYLGIGFQCLSLFAMQVTVIEYWYNFGLVTIYMFVFSFAISLGSTLYTYQTEILPPQAIPIVSSVQWSLTFLISSYSLDGVTQSVLFSLSFLFFMTSLFGFFVFQGYSVETKNKSDSKILARWAKKTFMDA